jgi:hypothetical protein
MNGSNPAHGDAKTKDAATECAEVFALPLRASRAHWDSQRLINAHGSVGPQPQIRRQDQSPITKLITDYRLPITDYQSLITDPPPEPSVPASVPPQPT